MIRHLEARARLPRLGVIRLGVKEISSKGKEYPKETAWFVVPDELKTVVGERPTKLAVVLPSSDIERVFSTEYVRYQGKLKTLACNGEKFREFLPNGKESQGDCQRPVTERDDEGQPTRWGKCPCDAKAEGRLNVIIWDSPLGIYQIVIGGEQRIADLFTELSMFKAAMGRLTDVIFSLERIRTEMQVRKEDGTRLARTGYPVHLRADFTAAQALRLRGLDVSQLPGAPRALAAAPEEEDEEGNGTVSPPESVQQAPGLHATPPGASSPLPAPSDAPSGEASAPQAEPVRPEPLPLRTRAEFTLERAYKEAETVCGVTATAYRLYLRAAYKSEDLDDLELHEQRMLLEEARQSQTKAAALKAAILGGANKTAKQGRLV